MTPSPIVGASAHRWPMDLRTDALRNHHPRMPQYSRSFSSFEMGASWRRHLDFPRRFTFSRRPRPLLSRWRFKTRDPSPPLSRIAIRAHDAEHRSLHGATSWRMQVSRPVFAGFSKAHIPEGRRILSTLDVVCGLFYLRTGLAFRAVRHSAWGLSPRHRPQNASAPCALGLKLPQCFAASPRTARPTFP